MKYAAVSILLIAAAVIVFRLLQPAPTQAADMGTAPPIDASAIAAADAEVFRRIFWRQPGEADKIIQSLRRERAGRAGDPVQWDWFLAVDASAEFAEYLLQENPFQLSGSSDAIDLTETPAWFPQSSSGYAVHRSLNGEMTILVNPENQRIYAWNQARSFQAASELPSKQPSTSSQQSSGRLPDARPPIPE